MFVMVLPTVSLLFNRKFSDILIFSYCSIHDRLLTLCFYFIFLLTKRTSKVFVVVLTSNTSRENSIRIKIYFFLREDKATLVNVFLRPQQHTILNFFFIPFLLNSTRSYFLLSHHHHHAHISSFSIN
jgi:hypothetical protein